MSEAQTTRTRRPTRRGVWSWTFDATLGNAYRLTRWMVLAVLASIVIEWIGMIFFWGPEHSSELIEQEMAYLGTFSRNLITGFYPAQLGITFVETADRLVQWLHLRELSAALAGGVQSVIGEVLRYGVESVINILFLFAIRLAICASAVSGFVLVGLVAVIDGLIERDIRRACGGIESSLLYHAAKRLVVPVLFLSFGGYLTLPISVHPTAVFLPVIALFACTVFIWAKSFKKFM